jgi:Holliday junction DNA helicase RuvA
MIATLRGNITELGSRYAVVDIRGIGYKVFITDDTAHTLKIGNEMTFWTHLAVREDAQDLYGFLSRKERDFFQLLITVSGIGPKSALNILSLVSSDTLSGAIRTGSVSHLVKVSGIGKKTAEKIVLELKDKLGGFTGGESGEMSAGMSSDMDAIEALKALGYEADDAREALKKIVAPKKGDKEMNTGAKVKAALKELS